MIKNSRKLRAFEDSLIRRNKVDPKHNFLIVDELYKEARALEVFPLKEPLSGLDVDIKIARVINSVPKTTQ